MKRHQHHWAGLAAIAIGLVGWSLSTQASDGDQALASLETARQQLARKVDALRTSDHDGDYLLVLPRAVDGDDLHLTLTHRAGKWSPGEASVPYWQQEGQKEVFSFLHRNRVQSIERGKFTFPVRSDSINVKAGSLTGKAIAQLRLDSTRDERMPPGGKHLHTVDGRWSLMDQWQVTPKTKPRDVEIEFDARVTDDRREFILELPEGMDGRQVELRFRLPARILEPVRVHAPRYNASIPRGELGEIAWKGDAIKGDITVRFSPDPWWPRDRHVVRYTINATIREGQVTGAFDAKIIASEEIGYRLGQGPKTRRERSGPNEWKGALHGKALCAVEGRFKVSGDMPSCEGIVRGGLLPLPNSLAVAATKAVERPTNPLARAHSDHHAIRVSSALADGATLRDALAIITPEPAINGQQSDEASRVFISTLAAAAGRLDQPRAEALAIGRVHPDDPHFGPYYATTPLTTDEQGVARLDGDTKRSDWQEITSWRVLGPFPQGPVGISFEQQLPPVLPLDGIGYKVDAERLGQGFESPKSGLITWGAAKVDGHGVLHPPAWVWGKRGRESEPGRPDSRWFAAAKIQSDQTRRVWLAVDAHDHAKLWINNRLVWVDEERELTLSRPRPAVFQATFSQGTNDLLAEVRDDRGGSYLSMHLATHAKPLPKKEGGPRSNHVADSSHTFTNAKPPLAWNLERGINIDWSIPAPEMASGTGGGVSSGGMTVGLPASDSPMLAVGDALLLNAEPHTIICIDQATGKERWRRETNVLELLSKDDFEAWNKTKADDHDARLALMQKHAESLELRLNKWGGLSDAAPVTDGRHVWAYYRTGVAACYDLAGKRKWIRRVELSKGGIQRIGKRILISGRPTSALAKRLNIKIEGGKRKRFARHAVYLLDPATGEGDAQSVPGDYSGKPFPLELPHDDSTVTCWVARNGSIVPVDAPNVRGIEKINLHGIDWDWDGVAAAGDTLYSTYESGRAAIRFWIDARGRIGHRVLWRGNRFHAYVAGGPGSTVVHEGIVYAVRLSPEHAKHCPAYTLCLDMYDTESGRLRHRFNPVLRGSNRRYQPTIAGDHLFIPDGRGPAHSGGKADDRQVVVVRLRPEPRIVALNDMPYVDGAPTFAGDRMFLRAGDKIHCIRLTSGKGEAYQNQHVASMVLSRLYPPMPPASTRAIKPLESKGITLSTPIVPLSPGEDIGRWLIAGPLSPHDVDAAPARLGIKSPAKVGDAVKVGDTQATLRPLESRYVDVRTTFFNDARLDDWQQRVTAKRIDVVSLLGEQSEGVLYLWTLIHNDRERVIYPTMPSPLMHTWINGEVVRAGEPVRLGEGRYAVLVRVDPAHLGGERQVRIDVAKALQEKAVQSIEWPSKWRVSGPVPDSLPRPEAKQLSKPGDTLSLGDQPIDSKLLEADGHMVDLMKLLSEGTTRPPGGSSAYAFATIEAPTEGTLLVNATADWFMAWYVDGERVYDTLKTGNGADPLALRTHPFSVKLTKGKHTIAVMVRPGSKGWSFSSAGAFTANPTDELAKAYPPSGAVAAPERPTHVTLSFKAVDDPATVRNIWLAQVRQRRELLEWIVKTLPGSDEAARATEHLSALQQK